MKIVWMEDIRIILYLKDNPFWCKGIERRVEIVDGDVREGAGQCILGKEIWAIDVTHI